MVKARFAALATTVIGHAIVSVGGVIHPDAPERVTPVTAQPLTVAVAVGSVVQKPQLTMTVGAEVYP